MYQSHPLADIYPMMDTSELDALIRSVSEHGLREPILLHQDGRILDGRNRQRACVEAEVELTTRTFTGTDDEALKLIVDLNSVRRHLTASQKGLVAARLANYSHGGARRGSAAPRISQRQAAHHLGVSERTVRDARAVLNHGDTALTTAVEEGLLAVRRAVEILQQGGHERLVVAELHRLRRVSKNDTWRTPRHILALVQEVLGHIDLDPASNEGTPWVNATRHYTIHDDGLAQAWAGTVFLNPPWNAQASPARWVRKLVHEYENGRVTEAILLVPSRTNTEWTATLREYVRCHVRGRLRFSDGPGAAAFATAIFYLGRQPDRFANVFSTIGDIYGPMALMPRP